MAKAIFYPKDFWSDGRYMIRYADQLYEAIGMTSGSFQVISARILGLSLAEFYRFARDEYNGTLSGTAPYFTLSFARKEDCQELCRVLNNRWYQLAKIWDLSPHVEFS